MESLQLRRSQAGALSGSEAIPGPPAGSSDHLDAGEPVLAHGVYSALKSSSCSDPSSAIYCEFITQKRYLRYQERSGRLVSSTAPAHHVVEYIVTSPDDTIHGSSEYMTFMPDGS